jgi:ASC-1-like (ASCH) protein
MVHELKTLGLYFWAVKSGKKSFEVRRNDRNYKEGDILRLMEWSEDEGYTGSMCYVKVLYILREWDECLQPGSCIMGIVNIKI